MKPSEITTEFLREFLRIDDLDENAEKATVAELNTMQAAAVQFAESYTGLPMLSDEGERCLNDYEDVTLAILALVADMYENRTANLDKPIYKNKTVECILSMHSFNLI